MAIDVDVVELFVVRRWSLVSSSRSAALIESLRFSIVDVGSCHASFVFSSISSISSTCSSVACVLLFVYSIFLVFTKIILGSFE